MKLCKYWLLLISICWLLCGGCKDYSRVHLISDSAEKTIELVEKHKDELDKIDVAYEKRTKYSLYGEINRFLLIYWASPEIMDQWYKIRIESTNKSARWKKYLNTISCDALVWFIRAGDWKAVQQLPELTEYPLFEEARRRYLYSSPQGFASWAKENINTNTVPLGDSYPINCFGLLESAALLVQDFDLAHNANIMLCNNMIKSKERGFETFTFAVSNLAFYIDKLGKVTDEDKAILTDYYNERLKDKQIGKTLKKRKECILRVLEKYHIVPKISILPDEKY